MQKDLANATESLSEGLNNLYNSDSNTKSLMLLVKRQAEEIDRRTQALTEFQKTVKLQQESLLKLQQQNSHLEALLETMKQERARLLEEVQELSAKKQEVKVKAPRQKKVAEEENATESA